MLVVVKKPRTKKPELEVRGKVIPAWIISRLKKDFGKAVKVEEEKDDGFVDVFETEWYKEMQEKTKPGDVLAAYRFREGMTRKALAEKVGTTYQRIYDYERGKRDISKAVAKKLASVFKTSAARFI